MSMILSQTGCSGPDSRRTTVQKPAYPSITSIVFGHIKSLGSNSSIKPTNNLAKIAAESRQVNC